LFATALMAHAQRVSKATTAFADSLSRMQKRLARESDQYVDTVAPSPYLYRMMGPSTYYRDVVKSQFSLAQPIPVAPPQGMESGALFQLYAQHPELVRYHDGQFQGEQVDMVRTPEQQNIAKDVADVLTATTVDAQLDNVADVVDDIGLEIKRPNFWKAKGTFKLQLTQNYFSENWYKGGDNNYTLLTSVLLELKYDDQRRITWENRLDMRLGFVATSADTCHNYITNNDKLNLYSKLGVKAAKSWYYTASVEANTQFLPGYRVNDARTYSKFCAPLDFYASLGMDFKPSLKNGNELSVALLPLSYKFRYIRADEENIHRSYKMVGQNFHQDFGMKAELKLKLKIAKDFYWRNRSYFFTSYKYAEAELENAFQYQFSRYIAAELYTLWRFDDNRSPDFYDDNLGYFQFKEYFTLGLTYNF
jgi:hypothetical protein